MASDASFWVSYIEYNHIGVDLLAEIVLHLWVGVIQVFLEITKRYFIGVLKFPIIFALFLHSIISQVYHPIR